MNKIPKFLVANSRDNKREFVIHTQSPVLICEVKYNDGGAVDIDSVYIEQIPNPDAKRLAGLIRRMGDWYYSTKKSKNENNN